MGVRTSYAVVLFVAGSLCATAQHVNYHANFKVFGFESGLGNLSVESVVQDRQGFLWVATEGGLFRYDGDKFESGGDGLGLPEYWPRGLHCSRDGALWVGTSKGLYVKRGAHFEAVPIAGVEQIRGRQAIDSDASGRVYVATPAGLMAGGPGHWRRIWPGASLAVKVFSEDEVWFGCGREICRWDGHAVRRYGAAQGVPADEWSSFAKDQRGRLYGRAPGTLVELAAEQGRWVRRDRGLGRATEGGTLFVDPAGRLMAATDDGLAMLAGKEWRYIRRRNGLPTNVVSSMYEDREGNVWVATNGGGLARWQGYGEWEAWTEAEGLVSEMVWSILEESSARYWIGTVDGISILELAGNEWKIRQPQGPAHPYRILTMVRDQQGRIWVASAQAGFERADEKAGGLRRIGASTPINAQSVLSAVLDRDNRLWAATKRGLYRSTPLDGTEVRFEEVRAAGEASGRRWWTVTLGPDGTVWAGGKDGLLACGRGGVRLYTTQDGLLDNDVYQILPLADEVLAAYDSRSGLTLLRRGGGGSGVSLVRHERIGPQYESERFYSLTADRAGKLYAGTGNGVLTYDGRRWGELGMADGLVWADCSSGAIMTDTEGAIWIGTSEGLSRYAPNPSLRRRYTPRIVVTSVLAGGKALAAGDPPSIPYDLNSLDFQFAGLTFTDEPAVRFRYRLEGLEKQWTETRARSARYAALRPGRYQFQVQVRSAAGVWSAGPGAVVAQLVVPGAGSGAAAGDGVGGVLVAREDNARAAAAVAGGGAPRDAGDRRPEGGDRAAAGQVGAGQPRQKRVSGAHEPRIEDATDRRAGDGRSGARKRYRSRAAGAPGDSQAIGDGAAEHPQRHSRPVEDRGRPTGVVSRGFQPAAVHRRGARDAGRAGPEQGAGADGGVGAGRARVCAGRCAAAAADCAEPAGQRAEIHSIGDDSPDGRGSASRGSGGGCPGGERDRARVQRGGHGEWHPTGAADAHLRSL
jgi:ligand-binding sensor domain-containing protein